MRSDAWICLSIGDAARAGEWATLELESAVSDLMAAGLVEISGTDTRLTGAGQELYREATSLPVGNIRRMLDLTDEWERRGDPAPAVKAWSIDHEAARRAGLDPDWHTDGEAQHPIRFWLRDRGARIPARAPA